MAAERKQTKGRKRADPVTDLTARDGRAVRGGSATEQDKYLENGRFKVGIAGCEKSSGGSIHARTDLIK
jgi:hypothetical protein